MKSEIKNIVYIDGKFYMKVNVVVLTTNKESKLRLDNHNKLSFEQDIKGLYYDGLKHTYQHLYITSDEEIKEGDWMYSIMDDYPTQWDGDLSQTKNPKEYGYNKIIATTDTSIKFGEDIPGIIRFKSLPQPSQEFIEDWVTDYGKGKIITDVLVEYEEYKISKTEWFQEAPYICKYDDVRIKTNPKDNTITIRKQKDSWNREEAIELCKKAFIAGGNFEIKPFTTDLYDVYCPDIDEWIEENL